MCAEKLWEEEVLKIATLAAGTRSKAKTPHCNPASLRELVIKTHKLPVSPKLRMLSTSQLGIRLCVCSLKMSAQKFCEKHWPPVSVYLCFGVRTTRGDE